MKNKIGWGILGVLLALVVIAEIRAANPHVGKPVPDFTLKSIDGTKLKLSDYKGKVVILDFWATWCPPCREEIPTFIQLQKEYGDKGLAIIGISIDEDGAKAVKPFAAKNGMNYPQVLADNKVQKAYGDIEVIPTTFIVDRAGNLVSKHVGLTPKEEFVKEITPLLKAEH